MSTAIAVEMPAPEIPSAADLTCAQRVHIRNKICAAQTLPNQKDFEVIVQNELVPQKTFNYWRMREVSLHSAFLSAPNNTEEARLIDELTEVRERINSVLQKAHNIIEEMIEAHLLIRHADDSLSSNIVICKERIATS